MATRREFLMYTAAWIAATSSRTARISNDKSPTTALTSGDGLVQTVLGPIDPSKLGFTLTHEHVIPGPIKLFGSRPISVSDAVDRLKEARDSGVDTVVDLSPGEDGRDVRFVEEVSRKSGMQIVVCTGQRLFPPELRGRTTQALTELFIREIELGIDDTGIRAGVIKAATESEGVRVYEERVLRAAARASKATGVPIETHSNSRLRGGINQVVIFEAEGVSPARVAIGHSDDTDDMEYLIGLVRRGYTVGMDHAFWGMNPAETLPWQKRVETVKRLIDAGFVDKMFFSNDWVHGDVKREQVNPDGMLFTIRKTIPYLEKLGVSEQHIQAIAVQNPKRFFTKTVAPVEVEAFEIVSRRYPDAQANDVSTTGKNPGKSTPNHG